MRQLTQLTCDLHRQLAHADQQRPAERLLAPRQARQLPATVEPADGRTFPTRSKRLGEP
jgi:hypothetical protein